MRVVRVGFRVGLSFLAWFGLAVGSAVGFYAVNGLGDLLLAFTVFCTCKLFGLVIRLGIFRTRVFGLHIAGLWRWFFDLLQLALLLLAGDQLSNLLTLRLCRLRRLGNGCAFDLGQDILSWHSPFGALRL